MKIDLTYHHLVRHVVPGPQNFSYFVPLILLPIALLIPRTILSRWQSILIFIPVMIVATVHAWTVMDGVDVISVDVLLWSLLFIGIDDPWKDFRYLRTGNAQQQRSAENGNIFNEHEPLIDTGSDSTKNSVWEQAYPSTLPERLPWVGRLLVSLRLHNWKIGKPSHDKQQPVPTVFFTRWRFVKQTLFSFIRGYLTLDLTRAYISYDAYFTDTSIPISSTLPFIALQWIPPQLFRSAIIGAQAWACVSQMFYLPCLLPVALNAMGLLSDEWSPHTWAPHFGSPKVILRHGVRGFWRRYWHQAMKLMVSGPGYAVADGIGLKQGGFLRYAIITIIAFGLSGVTHMG